MSNKIPTVLEYDKIFDFIKSCSPGTKVYIGCDSERHKVNGVWYADYIQVVAVHMNINGSFRGCRLFGAAQRERDYDQNKHRPSVRLMTEVYKVAEAYIEVAKHIDNPIAIHLDINDNKKYGSSAVLEQAVGYIRGVCGIEPEIKPNSFAASYAADRYKEISTFPASEHA